MASPASREQAVGAVNVGGVTFRTGRAIFSRVNGDAHFERADFIPDRALGMLLQCECKLQRLAAFEQQDGMIPVYLGDLSGMPPGKLFDAGSKLGEHPGHVLAMVRPKGGRIFDIGAQNDRCP